MKVYEKIRSFRLAQNISQEGLGNVIGVGQPIISRFETGQGGLSKENIEALCAHLGIPLGPEAVKKTNYACANIFCPMSLIFVAQGKLKAKPLSFQDAPGKVFHCPACGSVMIDACVRNGCGAPLGENAAFCHQCGEAYVPVPPELRDLSDPTDFQEKHNFLRDKFIETKTIHK